jgi:type IV pilus assembly protein PilM
MFEFFKNKNNHFIGVDFGTSFLKVVELSFKNQQIYLENYGVVDLNWISSENANSFQGYEGKMVACLSNLIQKADIKTKDVNISIPGFSGLVTIIEFPIMKEDELAKAIQFEAHKYIPASMDEMAISWEVVKKVSEKVTSLAQPLPVAEEKDKKMEVLLVAAPKKEIGKYESFIVGAGLNVKSIELETFSIARSLANADSGNVIVIDIGARSTNILFISKGTVRMNRSINTGGNEFTTTISDGLSISKQRAEILKKGEKDLINSSEGIVIPALELIAGEALRVINSYLDKNKGAHIDGVFLSGGTAHMKGMEEYFSKTLGITATIGNPWKNIQYDPRLKKSIESIGSSFSVVIGLALRGIDEYKRGQ